MIYKKDVDFVEQKIKEENVPTNNPRGLAVITVLTANWAFGDAYAGLLLEELIRKNRDAISKFVESILEDRKNPNTANLLLCFNYLQNKHKIFKALHDYVAGKYKSIEEAYSKV